MKKNNISMRRRRHRFLKKIRNTELNRAWRMSLIRYLMKGKEKHNMVWLYRISIEMRQEGGI
jgi:hypothetical protein